ncbi:MAG TPA: stage V sporulation T C-terminal domain-containing protein [Clostridia bacterium]|nr:stage V sporulation T C-terminal domain-containing protein [Clostridia bacterium]
MKATGIVRRIDDLGRVVIPKEIRRTMRIREGDPLEIYTDADGEVVFKKYSPVGELLAISKQYAEVLYRGTNLPVIITDRDRVVSCAGLSKKEALDRRVSPPLEDIIENRTNYVLTADGERIKPIEGLDREAGVACPIIGGGDVSGAVVLLLNENGSVPTQTETKLTQVAASFLGKQVED